MRGYAISGVGFIHVSKRLPAHITNIESIVVNDEFQQLGLGTALFKLVMRDADREEQELWMVSVVQNSDHWMNQWYERLGFKLRGGYYIRNPESYDPPPGANAELARTHNMTAPEDVTEAYPEEFGLILDYKCPHCLEPGKVAVQPITSGGRTMLVGQFECEGCGTQLTVNQSP